MLALRSEAQTITDRMTRHSEVEAIVGRISITSGWPTIRPEPLPTIGASTNL